MVMGYLSLLSGLLISGVAIYYSVAGLISIFSAAVWPIIIMGTSLELAKLVATLWLKQNWNEAPKLLKGYLIIAVTVLMVITSLGIFGFLSKAHMDQTVVSGDSADKVAIIDEKIRVEKENIEVSKKALKQLDEVVDQVMLRSSNEQGAAKSATIRKSQQADRQSLRNDIVKAQEAISKLNNERAPLAKEQRKVEAEVGPIKYVAALLYGDNPDQHILEKAVRFVIILLVIVFDPLAVTLLLASQYSFDFERKNKNLRLFECKNNDSELPRHTTTEDAQPDTVSEHSTHTSSSTQASVILDSTTATSAETTVSEVTVVVEPIVVNSFVEELPIECFTTMSTCSTIVIDNTSTMYVQNEEQSEGSVWNRIAKTISAHDYYSSIKKLKEGKG